METSSDQKNSHSQDPSSEEGRQEQKNQESVPQKTESEKEETVLSLPDQGGLDAKKPPEEDENLLVENDGDFFWILQRVLWGVLKTGVVVGLIVFLVWLIWHPGGTLKDETESNKESPRAETPVKHVPPFTQGQPVTSQPEIIQKHSIFTAAQWAHWMEKIQIFERENVLLYTLDWLRRASAFFSVPTENLVQGETADVRKEKVYSTLSELQEMLEEASRLQLQLGQEINDLSFSAVEAKSHVEENDRLLLSSIQAFRPDVAGTALDQKISAQKIMYENASQLEAYRMVEKYRGSYAQFLRTLYENIFANQKAIIEDIHIVVFPNDPFRRMLTPAEWRMRESQR
ncbi:hypothetical protein K9L63_02720 [Candidatus Gracilibacteria bacterium]|nr:hypothetical protein [Candidatus Gracilibacteria bacterium]